MGFIEPSRLIGEGPGDDRVDRAVDFLVRYWGAIAGQYDGAGWQDDYQAMFTMMKGLEGLGIDLLPAGGPGPEDDIDWFVDVARYAVDDQNPDGSWSAGGQVPRGGPGLNTAWALLTLEKAVPQIVTEIPVPVDIKPGSCPNAFGVKQKGVTPIAIAGTDEVPADAIDPATVRLTRLDENGDPIVDEMDAPIFLQPLRWSYEDVATPYDGELCGCHELMGDGIMDLSLKFSSPEMVEKLNLADEEDKALVQLTIVGNLFGGESDVLGTPIKGADCLRLNNK